jgi:hypothetical protein
MFYDKLSNCLFYSKCSLDLGKSGLFFTITCQMGSFLLLNKVYLGIFFQIIRFWCLYYF